MKQKKMELKKSLEKENLKHFTRRISKSKRNHQRTQSLAKTSQNVLELSVSCLLSVTYFRMI